MVRTLHSIVLARKGFWLLGCLNSAILKFWSGIIDLPNSQVAWPYKERSQKVLAVGHSNESIDMFSGGTWPASLKFNTVNHCYSHLVSIISEIPCLTRVSVARMHNCIFYFTRFSNKLILRKSTISMALFFPLGQLTDAFFNVWLCWTRLNLVVMQLPFTAASNFHCIQSKDVKR